MSQLFSLIPLIQVTVDDVPIRDLNIEWLRNRIGLVSQEPVLFTATVEENLKMGNEDVSEQAMLDAAVMANAHEFILQLAKVSIYASYRLSLSSKKWIV